jgi:hypothetical protein
MQVNSLKYGLLKEQSLGIIDSDNCSIDMKGNHKTIWFDERFKYAKFYLALEFMHNTIASYFSQYWYIITSCTKQILDG